MSVRFDQQIKKRINYDRAAFDSSFSRLSSLVQSDANIAGSKDIKIASKEAIEEILNWYGTQLVELPEDIEDINEQLEYTLKQTGIMSRRIELTEHWWKKASGPLLGCTVAGNAVALMPGLFSGYSYYDYVSGKRISIDKKTSELLQTDGFSFYRPLPAKKLSLWDIMVFMSKSISGSDILMVCAAALLVTVLGMMIPFINKLIFDSIIPSGIKNDVVPAAILLFGAAFASAFFKITKNMVINRLGDKVRLSLESAVMNRVLSLKAGFFKDFSSGELSNRLGSIDGLCKILTDTVVSVGLSVVLSMLFIFQMWDYAPGLVAPGMTAILLVVGFTVIAGIVQYRLSRKQMKVSAALAGLVYQLFSGIHKIKLAGAEKRAFARWALKYAEQGKLTFSPPVLLRIQSAIAVSIAMGGSLLVYYAAGVSEVSVSNYIAFNSAYGIVCSAVMQLAGTAALLSGVKPLMEMIEPLLSALPELGENKTDIRTLSGGVTFSNVTFSYTEDGPAIIKNLSLKVNPGEYVAIVGKTGCGKSTLVRLLLGFEKPRTGAVYYDGMDLESLDIRSVRRNIGVVMQNGKLFSGDIYSNIVISAPWLTVDEAWEAARMAGLEEDIKAMPMGMNTIIGEGSGGISGGQRQRLMISRAIAPKPKIIIFDEATSALDNLTQKIVADSVAGLNSTRIVIAHRLSTIKSCDRIIVLDNGGIAEQGTFEELFEKRGLFYELAARQLV